MHINENPMFLLIQKMKWVKLNLISWIKDQRLSNPQKECALAKRIIQDIQECLIDDPTNANLLNKEKEAMKDYHEATRIEENARQKSRATTM